MKRILVGATRWPKTFWLTAKIKVSTNAINWTALTVILQRLILSCFLFLPLGNNILFVAHASSLEACTRQIQGLSPQNPKDFVQVVRKVNISHVLPVSLSFINVMHHGSWCFHPDSVPGSLCVRRAGGHGNVAAGRPPNSASYSRAQSQLQLERDPTARMTLSL